jgi:two-component system NtrC family sensor kinase
MPQNDLSQPPVQSDNQALAALKLIVDAVQVGSDLGELQKLAVEGCCEVLDGTGGSLLLLNDGYGDVLIKDIVQGELTWKYQVVLNWEQGLVEGCIQKKTSFAVNDLSNYPRSVLYGNLAHIQPVSLLCAPLVVNDQVIGALTILNKRSGVFGAFDQALLTSLAPPLAYALYNARLIQQLKIANAELETSSWQLLRSRNTLRALFDNIPASIYIIDRKYNLIAINLERAKLKKTHPTDLVGQKCYQALYERDDPCTDCQVQATLFGGQATARLKRQWNNNGESQEWEINSYPIFEDNAQVGQAILLEQDVTEKRSLEATLAQSEKMAAVGQLAAGIAHEISNPLTAIVANAQLLQRELPGDDDRQEMVDLIMRAGARATQVVRNLLDLARKEQYEFRPTDINETIRKALALIHHEFVARSVTLTCELADDLPLIDASQDHLQGVWLNIFMNAIDALENKPGEVRVSTRQQGKEIRVSIGDTGKGIPAERLPRIFEPFYTTKEAGRGTGLGLSVCHRIVKQHGGHIEVNSQVRAGTEFVVVLPLS